MKHEWTNYIVGKEYPNGSIKIYAGKTRDDLEYGRKAGLYGGLYSYHYDTIHANNKTKNDKLTEQRHINTVRAVAKLLPEVIDATNINDDGYYGHVGSISQSAFDKIVAWVQSTRVMTEKRMEANKRKLARKLAQMRANAVQRKVLDAARKVA